MSSPVDGGAVGGGVGDGATGMQLPGIFEQITIIPIAIAARMRTYEQHREREGERAKRGH